MTKSRVLAKLRDGDFVKVAGISRVMHPWLAETVGRIGYDCIWLDLEHRPWGYDAIDPISLACRSTGIDLMARIHKAGYGDPMRALEFGANGLMVPHIRSAQEARQWVEWSRFPPLGKRGMDGAGADADYALANPREYLEHVAQEVFLVFQIEDRDAVETIDEIADVEGFDVFFVGMGDLSLSYGVPFDFGNPILQEALERVAEAAQKTGRWWGTPTGTPEHAQRIIDLGGRMITAGGDHMALLKGFQNSFEDFSSVRLPS